MNLIDVIIVLLILMGGVIGYKSGVVKQTISFVGVILILILSFMFKNSVSTFLYNTLPFFNFDGVFKGITSLNILLYEVLAFFLVLSILVVILKVLIFSSKVIEKVLDFTIILGFFSGLAGAVVGMVQYYIIVFIMLYITSFPMFNIDILGPSKYRDPILTKTPILNDVVKSSINVIKEFSALTKIYESNKDSNKFNLETLDLFLKHKIISVSNTDNLIKNNKLRINNVESVLKNYR